MNSKSNTPKFVLFRYHSEKEMLVAVASEYMPKIEHALKEFGDFKDIPPDWEVRGIFLDSGAQDPDAEAQQSEIVLNRLKTYKTCKSSSNPS